MTTDDARGDTCWRCGGPCLTYRGTVHGWTCTACLSRYLAEGAAKAEAKDRRDRARLLAERTHPTSVTADQRQEGGARVMYRPPSDADRTEMSGGPALRTAPLPTTTNQEGTQTK